MHYQLRECGGYPGTQRIKRIGNRGDVCREHCSDGAACEWRTPRQHFIRKHAPRVDVCARVCRRVAACLLRCHVGRSTERDSDRRQPGALTDSGFRECLGDAEVSDHRGAGGEQHVVRLDVAMQDAIRVCKGERARDFAEEAHGVAYRNCLSLLQPLAQGLALNVRHREKRQPCRFSRGEERDDVRVLQARGDGNLATEAIHRDMPGSLRRKHFHHHGPTQRDIFGNEDAGHSTAAEFVDDAECVSERGLQLLA
jgi:hypothetical protein